jgi:hypothetical protein
MSAYETVPTTDATDAADAADAKVINYKYVTLLLLDPLNK